MSRARRAAASPPLRPPTAARRPLGQLDMRRDGALAAALFASLIALAMLVLESTYPNLFRVEHRLSDFRTGWLADQKPVQHERLAVVLVDEDTMADAPYDVMDRALLARLVRTLDGHGAKAIGLDVVFYKDTEPEKDRDLMAAIREARAEIVIAAADPRVEILDQQRAYQRRFLEATGRQPGYATLRYDRDDTVRRKAGPANPPDFPVSFVARLTSAVGVPDPDPAGRIAWLRQPRNGSSTFFAVNARSLLDPAVGAALAPRFKDRIVLVGGGFTDRDRHLTPLFDSDGERGSSRVHGVFLHAHAIAQVLDGRRIREIEGWMVVWPISLLGFILGWSFRQLGFSWFVGGGATAVLIVLDILLFWQWRLVLPYTPATIAWFAGAIGGYVAGRALRRASPEAHFGDVT